MILQPKSRTLKRYWMIVNSPHTQLRTLELECMKSITIEGKCLELGGNRKYANRYHNLMNIKGNIETLNASEVYGDGVDIIADCNEALPIEDEVYDTVIAFNLFEHVKNDRFAVKEMMRVLKKGGTFHIIVPLMYRIHGAPFDFHRHSDLWWNESLIELQIKDETFTVEPLVWDMFATGASFFEIPFKCFKRIIRLFFCLPGLIRKKGKFSDSALGLYITGRKE